MHIEITGRKIRDACPEFSEIADSAHRDACGRDDNFGHDCAWETGKLGADVNFTREKRIREERGREAAGESVRVSSVKADSGQ